MEGIVMVKSTLKGLAMLALVVFVLEHMSIAAVLSAMVYGIGAMVCLTTGAVMLVLKFGSR
tara:strand:+ start:1678 stop:1860 length:183 start_codon:yes stop_codon:yes gene_type:complete